MPASLPKELRERIVKAHIEDGLSQQEIAELFKVGKTSVRRFLARHRAQESLDPRVPSGAPPKLGAEELEWIKARITENPYQSTYDLAEAYNEHFVENQVHRSTILRALKSLNLTHKKKRTWHHNETVLMSLKPGNGS